MAKFSNLVCMCISIAGAVVDQCLCVKEAAALVFKECVVFLEYVVVLRGCDVGINVSQSAIEGNGKGSRSQAWM